MLLWSILLVPAVIINQATNNNTPPVVHHKQAVGNLIRFRWVEGRGVEYLWRVCAHCLWKRMFARAHCVVCALMRGSTGCYSKNTCCYHVQCEKQPVEVLAMDRLRASPTYFLQVWYEPMGMISTLGMNLCLWMRYDTLRGGIGMICDYGMILILPMDKAWQWSGHVYFLASRQ